MESMIQETRTYTGRACRSANSVRNGTNCCGNAHYHCKDGGISQVLKPKQVYSEAEKATVLRAGLERCSLRGGERIFDIARQTVTRWIATYKGKDLLLPASVDDVLELDESWSVPRVAQRAALLAQVPPQACSMLALLTGKGSEIPLPS